MAQKKETFRELIGRIGSMFTFRRSGKFYTTFTRRMQLIQQVRTLRQQAEADSYQRAFEMRKRLKVEYK